MRGAGRLLIVGAIVLATLAAAGGCRSRGVPVFVPDGPARTYADVRKAAPSTDLAPADGVTVADATAARIDALTSLRTRGADGDRAATLLTKGFPLKTAAVPVRVEIASVDGVRAIIAVEAFGDVSGPLTHRRLWVFDYATGAVLHASSYR